MDTASTKKMLPRRQIATSGSGLQNYNQISTLEGRWQDRRGPDNMLSRISHHQSGGHERARTTLLEQRSQGLCGHLDNLRPATGLLSSHCLHSVRLIIQAWKSEPAQSGLIREATGQQTENGGLDVIRGNTLSQNVFAMEWFGPIAFYLFSAWLYNQSSRCFIGIKISTVAWTIVQIGLRRERQAMRPLSQRCFIMKTWRWMGT